MILRPRKLVLFVPSFKMSTREDDFSHYPLTLLDRIRIRFSNRGVDWACGGAYPILRTKRWTYHFNRKYYEVDNAS